MILAIFALAGVVLGAHWSRRRQERREWELLWFLMPKGIVSLRPPTIAEIGVGLDLEKWR